MIALALRRLESSIFESLQKILGVVVTRFAIGLFLLHRQHALDQTRPLDSSDVLSGIRLNDAVRVVSGHIYLDANLLVEANVAVVENEAVELELASLSESLLHLELAHVAVSWTCQSLNLDHILTSALIDHDEIPVGLLKEGVVLGDNVARTLGFGQVVVGDRDSE